MPKSNAERLKDYRKRLKENPEQYEEVKRKHREYMRSVRPSVKDLSEQEKNKLREQWKKASDRKRERKKDGSIKKRSLNKGAIPSHNLPIESEPSELIVKSIGTTAKIKQHTDSVLNKMNSGNEDTTAPEDVNECLECRACLQIFKIHVGLVNIFDGWESPFDGMEETIAENLAKLANIQILQTDRYSKLICKSCCQKLRDACVFTSLVCSNDRLLKERYRTSEENNVENEKNWPRPIQLDKNINSNLLDNSMDVEVKQEILSDEEYSNVNGINDSYREDYLNLDIKIEPEEIQQKPMQVVINGTIEPEIFNNEESILPNGLEKTLQEEHLDPIIKEEPLSDEDLDLGSTDLPLECMLCSKTFNSLSGLKVHVIAQHSYKTVKRKTCSSPLKKYNNIHTCSTCRRSFATSTDLLVHETCHNKYACYGCSDKFNTFEQLAEHRKKCKAIDNTTVKVKTLEDVQRQKPAPPAVKTENELQCPQCNERFSDTYYMNIHTEIHHNVTQTSSSTESKPVVMETEALEDMFND